MSWVSLSTATEVASFQQTREAVAECDIAQEVAAFRQVSSSSNVAAVVVVGSASRMMALKKEALFLHG